MTAGAGIIVPILRAGVRAQAFCRHGAQAEVAAVFERCCYLRCGDLFVCVGEASIGNGPLTLIAGFDGARPLPSLGLCPGQPAAVSERCIAIGDRVRLIFDRCTPWRQPAWPAALPACTLDEAGGAIAHQMRVEAPAESFAQMLCGHEQDARDSSLARIARPRMTRFESWLFGALDAQHGPLDAAPTAIVDLIGVGHGLTPSGDDFLVGVLALLDALGERQAHALLAHAITALPRGLTSALSECLLKTAAAGHVGEHLYRAVSAVVSGAPDEAVAAIRKIGHASGWDMMAGILTTLRAAATRDASNIFPTRVDPSWCEHQPLPVTLKCSPGFFSRASLEG